MSAVSESSREAIRAAYNQLLETRQLRPRWGQRQMIAEVANALARLGSKEAPAIGVIEAGTGTGKTIAYVIPALILAREHNKRLVVSTATVALQEQLVGKDLPDLQAASGLDFDYTLAKGRRRYLCLSQLDRMLAGSGGGQGSMALYPDELATAPSRSAVETYGRMLEALGRGDWDGDRDNWAGSVDDADWYPVTADQGQCTGRRCPNISQCSFYRAREGLQNADLIVTNHDLVLSDLGLGGGVILPSPEDVIFVFDEGHHLPDKALNHFASYCRLSATEQWLQETQRQLGRGAPLLAQLPGLADVLEPLDVLLGEVVEGLRQVAEVAHQHFDDDPERDRLRFEDGVVPEALRTHAVSQAAQWARIAGRLDTLASALDDAQQDDAFAAQRDEIEAWQSAAGGLLARAEAVLSLWQDFSATDAPPSPPRARWLQRRETAESVTIDFNCSPILAAELLEEQLWSRAAGAILTSATMTALGRFDRFRQRAGVPEEARYAVVSSPFDYRHGVLRVPAMRSDPGDAAAHTAELIEQLPELVDANEGCLVLFSSRRQMLDVRDGLPRPFRQRLLTQDDYSKQEVLRRHRQAIDDGRGSVIFGLASFAEGVDLPGDYCRHVLIAKLPFAVPDDPVDAALAEWLERQGRNPFMEISVPDAALRLVQASGRLLRTEQDRGRITLCDRRVLTRRYGQAILDSLPPFTRQFD